eukprot:10563640-Alexandrium_andersonii.AAC.1
MAGCTAALPSRKQEGCTDLVAWKGSDRMSIAWKASDRMSIAWKASEQVSADQAGASELALARKA